MGDEADYIIEQMMMGEWSVDDTDYNYDSRGRGRAAIRTRNSRRPAPVREYGLAQTDPAVCPMTEAEKRSWARQQKLEFRNEAVILQKLNPKETVNMETVTVNGELKTYIAVVNFLAGPNTTKDYDFFCNIPLQDKDIVVVDTVNGLQLAQMVGIKRESRGANNWVVDKVDTAAHRARIYKAERQKELQKAMKAELSRINELEQFRKAAEVNPALAAMLAEYEKLERGDVVELPSGSNE